MAHDPIRHRLKEKFGTFGAVNAIVKVAAARGFGFLHARITAAKVRDAGSPHFLCADWRAERRAIIKWAARQFRKPGDGFLKIVLKVFVGDKGVPGDVAGGIKNFLVFDDAACVCAIKFHGLLFACAPIVL